MRQPGQRMPVGAVSGCECPLNSRSAEPGLHLRVLGYVYLIVVINEFVPADLPIHSNGGDGQQQEPQEGTSLVERLDSLTPRLRFLFKLLLFLGLHDAQN